MFKRLSAVFLALAAMLGLAFALGGAHPVYAPLLIAGVTAAVMGGLWVIHRLFLWVIGAKPLT